jgi:hypothetical protein
VSKGDVAFWIVLTVAGLWIIIAIVMGVVAGARDTAVCEALGGEPVGAGFDVRCLDDPVWIELP